MRILFDAYWWIEGPFSNRTVQREFIWAWAAEFPEDELVLMVPDQHLDASRRDAPRAARIVGTRLRPHAAAAGLAAARIARRVRADLTVTHNFAPVSGPSAVFIHDMLFKTNPEWFTASERAYFALMPLLAPRAGAVITSSETEATRIRTVQPRLPVVRSVGLAIRTSLRTAEPLRPAHVPDRFLLTVGRMNVRKNLVTTIRAAVLSGAVSPECPLVAVGGSDGRTEQLPPQVRAAIESRAVIMLDEVTDGELAWLYSHARLFVFLSLDEGFGLTPVEALAFGAPCVVSDIPVFHETLADRVRYAPPRDVGAASTAIAQALADDRPAVSAPDLSWSQCVARIRAIVAPLAR